MILVLLFFFRNIYLLKTEYQLNSKSEFDSENVPVMCSNINDTKMLYENIKLLKKLNMVLENVLVLKLL